MDLAPRSAVLAPVEIDMYLEIVVSSGLFAGGINMSGECVWCVLLVAIPSFLFGRLSRFGASCHRFLVLSGRLAFGRLFGNACTS